MQLFISVRKSCLLSVPTILPLQRSGQCFLMVLLRVMENYNIGHHSKFYVEDNSFLPRTTSLAQLGSIVFFT